MEYAKSIIKLQSNGEYTFELVQYEDGEYSVLFNNDEGGSLFSIDEAQEIFKAIRMDI